MTLTRTLDYRHGGVVTVGRLTLLGNAIEIAGCGSATSLGGWFPANNGSAEGP